QRLCHLPHHQKPVPRLCSSPIQDFPTGKSALPTAAAAFQHQISVLVPEQRQKTIVVRLPKLPEPQRRLHGLIQAAFIPPRHGLLQWPPPPAAAPIFPPWSSAPAASPGSSGFPRSAPIPSGLSNRSLPSG